MRIISAFVLLLCLVGCGTPAGKNNVAWEFEGDDVRVIETFVDGDGDRRNFFAAATIESVSVKGHVVRVRNDGETFKVFCLDADQANELAEVLRNAMKKSAG